LDTGQGIEALCTFLVENPATSLIYAGGKEIGSGGENVFRVEATAGVDL